MDGDGWDASMPGAGAQRVCAVAQLYFRMINYGALTTLVVDALCNAFSEDGANVTELSNYLGVSEDRMMIALEAIPFSLRVTSNELDNTTENQSNSTSTYDALHGRMKQEQSNTGDFTRRYNANNNTMSNISNASRKRIKTEEMRYYLNFKRLLPIAYAHISYLLLSLCQVPLPTRAHLTNNGTSAFLSNNLKLTSEAGNRSAKSQELQQLRVAPTLFSSSPITSTNDDNNNIQINKAVTSSASVTSTSQVRTFTSNKEHEQKEKSNLHNEKRHEINNGSAADNVKERDQPHEGKKEDAEDLTDLVNATFNISTVLRRKEATCGVYCASCRSYFALEEFNITLCKCPMCSCDVLASILQEVKNNFDRKANNNEPLITPLPQVRAAFNARHAMQNKNVQSDVKHVELSQTTNTANSKQEINYIHTTNNGSRSSIMQINKTKRITNENEDNEHKSATRPEHKKVSDLQSKTTETTYALTSDPYLVQQALAFFYLYSTKFAYVSDARHIVNSEDILTESEYARRLDGRASIADQFRARHRNPHSIRVKVIDQVYEDSLLRQRNALKIAKRTQLPPWLRHQPILHLFQSTSANSVNTTTNNTSDNNEFVSSIFGSEVNNRKSKEELVQTWMQEEQEPEREMMKSKRTKHENREHKPNSSLSSTAQAKRQHIQHVAQYIASEFYDNDYDLVASWALPTTKSRR